MYYVKKKKLSEQERFWANDKHTLTILNNCLLEIMN